MEQRGHAVCAREPVHGLPDGVGETYRLFALQMPHEQFVRFRRRRGCLHRE